MDRNVRITTGYGYELLNRAKYAPLTPRLLLWTKCQPPVTHNHRHTPSPLDSLTKSKR